MIGFVFFSSFSTVGSLIDEKTNPSQSPQSFKTETCNLGEKGIAVISRVLKIDINEVYAGFCISSLETAPFTCLVFS